MEPTSVSVIILQTTQSNIKRVRELASGRMVQLLCNIKPEHFFLSRNFFSPQAARSYWGGAWSLRPSDAHATRRKGLVWIGSWSRVDVRALDGVPSICALSCLKTACPFKCSKVQRSTAFKKKSNVTRYLASIYVKWKLRWNIYRKKKQGLKPLRR